MAIEGNKLSVALESPLDSLLGFKRAPRTDAERKAAADKLARLRVGGALFKADAAAQCKLSKVEVTVPVLEAAGKPAVSGAAAKAAESDHADLGASLEHACAQPQQLRALEQGLFDTFPRMQRIEVHGTRQAVALI